jgi:hypothetical protein
VLDNEQIAVIVHEAHRGYSYVIGDQWSDPPWDGLPKWRREAVIEGVRAVRAGLTPSQMHENWRSYYLSLGWVQGPSKDPDGRPPTHPNLLPYGELPPDQQRKDYVFRAVVLALLTI